MTTSALSFQNSSTDSSGISFQGISSGIQTSQLVQATISQASLPLQQLQAQQTANTSRSTALTALEGQMTTLSGDIATLNSSGFTARSVSSSDPDNSYITATASGGASGSYTMQVQQTATAAELSPTLNAAGAPTNLAVASASAPVFTDTSGNETGSATFALEDTSGNVQQVTLSGANNNINGLANAINALQTPNPNIPNSVGLGIQATVVDTGSGANPYELILTSTTTGTGTTASGATGSNNISIADTTSGGAVNLLGIAAGSATTATTATLSPTLDGNGDPTNLAVADPASSAIFNSGSGTFAVEDTDGNTQQITLNSSDNTLNGLASAINSQPNLNVTASVAEIGSTGEYGLTLTANSAGAGTASGNVTIADVSSGGTGNNLGIATGTLNGAGSAIATGGTVSNQSGTNATITGGTESNQAATNAKFTLDGVQLTRSSNTVSDAVSGVTFNLIQGGQTSTTTLTVAPDVTTATADMQTVITDYNTLIQTYNTDAAQGGPLNGDFTTQGLINQISQALTGNVAGLSSSAVYNSAASLGLSTNEDGTLTLDTSTFGTAFQNNPTAAMNVFATSAASTSASVSLGAAGPNTATGVIGFDITSYDSKGDVAGTLTAPDGTKYSVTGTNGILEGPANSPLAQLYLSVTGTGTGTLTLSDGAGQATENAISAMTDPANGTIAEVQQDITNQNTDLANQIATQQQMLTTMQTSLETQYSNMEATLSQLQAAGQSINSLS
jgi:flagellar hook-associated protein 2